MPGNRVLVLTCHRREELCPDRRNAFHERPLNFRRNTAERLVGEQFQPVIVRTQGAAALVAGVCRCLVTLDKAVLARDTGSGRPILDAQLLENMHKMRLYRGLGDAE